MELWGDRKSVWAFLSRLLVAGGPRRGRRRNLRLYADSFAPREESLAKMVVELASQRLGAGDEVLLIGTFEENVETLRQAREQSGGEVEPDRAGGSGAAIRLLLAGDLIRRAQDEWSRWAGGKDARGRLSALILQRHPLAAEDEALVEALGTFPGEVRVAFFLSLDDPLVSLAVPGTMVMVLEQLGLHRRPAISSGMLSRRIEVAQRRVAATVQNPERANSAEEWLARNLPEPGV